MFKITLNTKIFWFVTSLLVFFNIILSLYIYKENEHIIEKKAYETSEALQQYFVSMRYVYHNQFMSSNLDINETTVGFLPAHASTLISQKFTEKITDGTTIRNVTDRPRNPLNSADRFELDAMAYFEKNPNEINHIKRINQNNRDYFHYTAPLKIDQYCLACHGKKEEVLESVKVRYDTAYNYNIGDIRGVTSVKVPVDTITGALYASFL